MNLLTAVPSPLSIGPLRAALTPRFAPASLSGLSGLRHIALTFDDGPDPSSTPSFLTLLDRLQVRATFFLLGRHLSDLGLVREMAAAGHEIGVHGWDHRPVPLHPTRSLRDGIVSTRRLIEDATGRPVTWYRPPYGVLTRASTTITRQAGMQAVLWSAWGRDWERHATPASVVEHVTSKICPGGTVLLHDSDRTSAPGSWRVTLCATESLVLSWQDAAIAVGPLADHGLDAAQAHVQVAGRF